MAFPPPKGPAIPIRHSSIVLALSLLCGWLANLLPWQVDWLWLRPDFLLLTLVYWAIYQPTAIGIGAAWWLGLLEDLSDGAHLGQHALGYALSIYILGHFQRRLYNFPPWQQALPVLTFLLAEQIIDVLVATFLGDTRNAPRYFISVLSGALCWFPLWALLHRLRTPTQPAPQ